MALDAEIMVGDIGTELVVEATDEGGEVVNIASASALTVYLTKPDGTVLTKTGTLDASGTDGLFKYTTVSGDLSVAGTWRIQGRVTLGSARWSTREATFKVFTSRGGV